MAGFHERVVAGLRIRIDRDLCVGFGDCIERAPEAFNLDAEGLAVFVEPERIKRAALLAACDACPVDAITVWDDAGVQIVPCQPHDHLHIIAPVPRRGEADSPVDAGAGASPP